MIVDAKTGEVIYPDPEEWVWVRRPPHETGYYKKDYCVAWEIQRKNLNKNDAFPCKSRVRLKDGEGGLQVFLDFNESVIPSGLIECSEREAFNYWKPIINYEIY